MSAAPTGRRALIVGCGIAGVVAAHALQQIGWDATIYEKAPDVRKIYAGTGIHLWNNAMRAITMLDLEDRIRAVSGPDAVVEEMRYFSRTGTLLATIPTGPVGRKIGGDCIGVNRAELLASLAEPLLDDVVKTGREAVGYETRPSGATLRFADGSEQSGDLVLGADGLHSMVRRQVVGSDEPPRYAGYTVWQGILPHASTDLAPLGVFQLVTGPGQRFGYFLVDDQRLFWFAVADADESVELGDGLKSRLLEMFRGWTHPCEAIIAVADEKKMYRRNVYDRDPVSTWGEGCVTLSGDAAHPMTYDLGQGAGMGIEDAVVLKRCLHEEADVPAALRAYERRRQPRTAHFQKVSRRIGQLGRWKHPVAVATRNLGTRVFFGGPLSKVFERDLTYDF